MAGTYKGGVKASITNKQRYGEDFFRIIGKTGGRMSRGGGFASQPREFAAAAGRKGGKASRRGIANGSY